MNMAMEVWNGTNVIEFEKKSGRCDFDTCVLIRPIVVCQGVKLWAPNDVGCKLRLRNQIRFADNILRGTLSGQRRFIRHCRTQNRKYQVDDGYPDCRHCRVS